jgi:hypothetical protein
MADPLLQWISDTLRAITDEAAPAPTKIETPNGVTIGIVRDGDEFEFEVTQATLRHRFDKAGRADKTVVAAYGLLVTPAGKRHLEVRRVTKRALHWAQDLEALRQRKPRPIEKLYGERGPTPEQVQEHKKAMTSWNTTYSRVRKAWKSALDAEARRSP